MEKFYNSEEWMTYLIDLFLKPGAVLASELAAKRGCGAVIAPQPPSAHLAPLAGLSAGAARRDV